MGSKSAEVARLVLVVTFLAVDLQFILDWHETIKLPPKFGLSEQLSPYVVALTFTCSSLGSLLVMIFSCRRMGFYLHMMYLTLLLTWLHGGYYLTAFREHKQPKSQANINCLQTVGLLMAVCLFIHYENRLKAQKEKYNKTL
eukprot:GHVS01098344.1.p1 GENE.GHVS01098344.1~~GHVS01098344.1.p1  ORF type:complete len:142 (+),score=6.05 GHVS01098344.1:444-869(+)